MPRFEYSINFWRHDPYLPEIIDECFVLLVLISVVMVDMTHAVPKAEFTACCTKFHPAEVAAAMRWWMNLYGFSSASSWLLH